MVLASSIGVRSSRTTFSIRASSSVPAPSTFASMSAGIVGLPAIPAARQRRSPATSSNPPAHLPDAAHLDAGELPRRRDHVEPVDVADDRVRRRDAAGEHVNQVHAERADLEPELARERELRVGVDDEHPPVLPGEHHGEVRSGRRLPYPAFLLSDHEEHLTSPPVA